MAKTYTNTIWRFEIEMPKRSGGAMDTYRVDINCADNGSAIYYTAANTIVLCDRQAIKVNWLWEFSDELPFGLGSDLNYDFEFLLEYLPDDLCTTLGNPFTQVAFTVRGQAPADVGDWYLNMAAAGLTFNEGWNVNTEIGVEIETSNIFKVYKKFSNDTYGASPDFRLIYTGVQKSGLDQEYDSKKPTFKVETVGIVRAIAEQFDMSIMNKLVYKDNVFDCDSYCWHVMTKKADGTAWNILTSQAETGNYFWFYRLVDFHSMIHLFLNIILKRFLRSSSPLIIFTLPDAVTYYKQTYDLTDLPGAALTQSNLYFLGHTTTSITFTSENDITGGFLTDLVSQYSNAWDYLTDYYLGEGCRGWIWYETVSGVDRVQLTYQKLIATDGAYNIYIQKAGQIWNDKNNWNSNVVKRCNAELISAASNDIDSYVSVKAGGRSGKEITPPIIWSNHVPAFDDYIKFLSSSYHDRISIGAYGSISPSYLGSLLFYRVDLSTEQSGLNSGHWWYVKVHEYCDFDFGNGLTNQDFIMTSEYDRWEQQYDLGFAIRTQSVCKAALLSFSLTSIFGYNQQASIEASIEEYEQVVPSTQYNSDWIWNTQAVVIKIENSIYNPIGKTVFNNKPKYYTVTSAKGDLQNSGIIDFTALSNVYTS